jgi:hypothetical protein
MLLVLDDGAVEICESQVHDPSIVGTSVFVVGKYTA